jgi:uncharacterized protein involved in exopolysaccharide biosynthesis/cellulose biosynthesis protein BcsQ
MKIHDIIRLIKKHIILLVLIPVLMGIAVKFLTSDTYSSKTTLYTGLTSGTNVQLDQGFNLFAANASFDNLINVVQSRETSKEVAIRLLAQHLMLNQSDPKYISRKSFLELRKSTPAYINNLVVKKIVPGVHAAPADNAPADTTRGTESFTFSENSSTNTLQLQPSSIDPQAYEQTVKNLEDFESRDDTNFIHRLISFNDPHYSIDAISSVTVQRINSSDLIELKYNSDDPGICQQTLVLITEVCMKNYKKIKETRSDAVVKYFEFKVKQSSIRLNTAEDNLMKFNQEHNVINYEDQSKDIFKQKDNLEAAIQSKRTKLAGDDVAIKVKLANLQKIQDQNKILIGKRNQLAMINAKIATAEMSGTGDSASRENIASLKSQADQLNGEIGAALDELYNANTANEGVSGTKLTDTWITSLKDYEETKTGLAELERRVKSSEKQYANFAPAGVILKKIEREITMAEQEYLEGVRGLNLAKLKVQDIELSSNIKAVDPPYYPEYPNPAKRMMLMALAALVGFLIVMSVILALEYFDATLKNPQKAAKILQLNPVGIYPRIPSKPNGVNLPFVTSRLLEMMIQQMELYPEGRSYRFGPRTILFFSTTGKEGKTTVVGSLARKLKKLGKKVVVINFSGEDLLQNELAKAESEAHEILTAGKTPELLSDHETSPGVRLLNDHYDFPEEHTTMTLEIPENGKNSEEHMMYRVDESYYSIKNYGELLERTQSETNIVPDYILIELPPVLYHPYPAGLVSSADLSILVIRSTRSWSQADQGALETLMKLTHQSPLFLLNGVDMQVVKSALGELPKSKSKSGKKKVKTTI